MERKIKKLLSSRKKSKRREGMVLLVEIYQEDIYRFLLYLNAKFHRPFQPSDLADILQEALISLWKNVLRRRVRYRGSLYSYICTIACRRAMDELSRRKRKPFIQIPSGFVDAMGPAEPNEELQEEVRVAARELTNKLWIVLKIEISMIYRDHARPTLDELTEEVNRELLVRGFLTIKLQAVKSRRERAWKQIRDSLRNRGYDE